MTREPIYAALFAKLAAIPGLVTTSRRLKHWADVPAEAQPALYQAQTGEQASPQTNSPTIWRFTLDVYLYVRTDGGQDPGPILNPLIDAISNALLPDGPSNYNCTLGGLVHYCRINGAIETDEGTLGDQAVAIVPIEILVTD